MDKKPLAMTLFTIVLFLATFAYSFFEPLTFFDFSLIPFSIIAASEFVFGALFFGFLAFIPAVLFGFQLGAEKNAAIFLYFIPLAITAYAGSKLGFATMEDLLNQRNLVLDFKKIFLIFLIGLIIAIAVEQSIPWIIEVWPKESVLDVKTGKTTLELLQEIKYI